MWFIGFEVEQETSAPLPKKNPGSAPEKLRGGGTGFSEKVKSCLTARFDVDK